MMDVSTENSAALGLNVTDVKSEINESLVPPVILFVMGVIGSITALVILIRSSTEHKLRPFYRFVGGLIASNLFGMVFSYPFAISAYVSRFTIVFPTALCGFMSFMLAWAFMTNAFTICAMSLDRFLAFIFPLTYRNLSNSYRINLTLFGIWISSAIICSLHVIGFGSYRSFYPGSWCFINFISDDAKDKAFTYLYVAIGFLINVSTITLNAIVIFSVCLKFCNGDQRSAKDIWNDVVIIIYLVAIVTAFTLCTTPMMIWMLITTATDNRYNRKSDLLFVRISGIRVLIDPCLYLLLKRRTVAPIRRLARSLIRRFRMRQVVRGESSQDTNTQALNDRTKETNI